MSRKLFAAKVRAKSSLVEQCRILLGLALWAFDFASLSFDLRLLCNACSIPQIIISVISQFKGIYIYIILDTASADLNITKPMRYTFSDWLLVALMYISVSQARSTMAIRTTGSQLGWTLTSLERRRLSVRFRPLASQKLKESKSNPSTSKNWNCRKSIEKSNK